MPTYQRTSATVGLSKGRLILPEDGGPVDVGFDLWSDYRLLSDVLEDVAALCAQRGETASVSVTITFRPNPEKKGE